MKFSAKAESEIKYALKIICVSIFHKSRQGFISLKKELCLKCFFLCLQVNLATTKFKCYSALGRVIFSLRESVIETLGFSVILFANKLAKRITLCEAQ